MKKKLLYSGLVALVILTVMGVLPCSSFGRVSVTHEYLITKYYRFQALDENGIVQWFQPDYNYLDSIELFIANIYPETDGKIEISLKNEKGKVIFKKRYEASSIPTGEFKEYAINEKLNENERFALCISYIGEEDSELGFPQLMVSEKSKNLLETQNAIVGDRVLDYNVAITYHYSQRELFGI